VFELLIWEMTDLTSLLKMSEVYAGYDDADVLSGITIEIKKGKITCLLGANGAGKSTVIKAILGLIAIRKGKVFFEEDEITRNETHEIVRKGIATIPEGRKVFPKLTVEENLQVGAILERDKNTVKDRFEKVMEIFPQLSGRKRQIAGTMSGGEQAMLSIGRGLMSNPKLLVIDEPSLGLSPLFVRENFKVIRSIRNKGVTILLVEQNVNQTLAISDYGYVISQGRVVTSGTSSFLKTTEQLQAAYFGSR